MKIANYLACFALATSTTSAASIPEINVINHIADRSHAQPRVAEIVAPDHSLERRKGGGGRGGGSSSSSSGGKSGGSSGGSSSGSSRTSSSSSTGGSTKSGSGAPRAYGGGYYGGGAAVPYQAGSRTPKGLVAAPLLVGAGALAIMPGLWLYSVYPYHFGSPYRFYNRTNTTEASSNGTNTSLPVTCLCQQYSPCGCDENQDTKYIDDLIGNGSYAALNKSLVTVSDVNGTRNLVLNGTLPNGTTAPGGSDDSSARMSLQVAKYAGYWGVATVVITGVML